MLTQKVISFDDLESKVEELNCPLYFETSALNEKRDTLDALFNAIIIELSKKSKPTRQTIRL